MAIGEILHKTVVVGLVGSTAYLAAYIPWRLWDVRNKANELRQYADERQITYKEAAQQLGYQPIDERWKKFEIFSEVGRARFGQAAMQRIFQFGGGMMGGTASRQKAVAAFGHIGRRAASNIVSSATKSGGRRQLPADVPMLGQFMKGNASANVIDLGNMSKRPVPKSGHEEIVGNVQDLQSLDGMTFHVETYGCQMNVSDTEIVNAVMLGAGMKQIDDPLEADVVLLNTCAVRDGAESKVWLRLRQLKSAKNQRPRKGKEVRPARNAAIGLLGCMAERLKTKVLEGERLVDFVAGPDAYRDIPQLIVAVRGGAQAINVQLSTEETYADVAPVRDPGNRVSAFISIMRGCNNMCSFCVVPFTRGRERSRSIESIVEEVRQLEAEGYREVTLLGQNVNSYWDRNADGFSTEYETAEGFSNTFKLRGGGGARFIDLLDKVSIAAPSVRFRFTSPHPKDFPLPLLQLIAERNNLCKSLHMPAQSGSTSVLKRMRRGYTRDAYVDLIAEARRLMPDLFLSTDMISGFCGETEEEHQDTVSLMREIQFDQAFMFAYSERSHTHAFHKMQDDVAADVKHRRLQEVIETFLAGSTQRNLLEIGKEHTVLVEGASKRSNEKAPQQAGRTDTNKVCVWDVDSGGTAGAAGLLNPGDYVRVRVETANRATLKVTPLARVSMP